MKSKILIIEDNDHVRENLAELLELSGYEVATAENGKMGTSVAFTFLPDLILCDVMMPEMDGFSVLRILSSSPATMDIPFIFLTAKTEKEDFRKGMGLGADDYITKPYDDIQLLDTIELRIKKSSRIKNAFDKSGFGLQKFIDEARGLKDFENLCNQKEVRTFQKFDVVYEAGKYPKWLYFVVSGSVKCFQVNDFAKEYTTNTFHKGDFFGYIPLLKNTPYMDNVSTLEKTELALIPPSDFNSLLFSHRDFAATFIKMLANRSEDVEKQLIDLAYSSVRKRVAIALLKYSQFNENNSFYLLREDIASMAGTTKETTIRTLSDFKNEGLIDIKDNKISLLKVEKLTNLPQ